MRGRAATARPSTRVRWKIFGLVWVLVLINFIDRSSVSVALPLIGKDLRLSASVEGWILSAFFWTYLLFQIPAGSLLDRLGPRRIVALSAAVWGVFQALGGIAGQGAVLLVSRLGLGAAEAPMFPAGGKLNANWLSPTERARGATFFDCGAPVGTAVGSLAITGLIVWLHSWRAAFVVAGAATILLSVWIYAYLRDNPRQHPAVSADEAAFITEGSEPATAEAPRLPLHTYLRSRSFWGLLLGRLGWALIWWGLITWGPQYLASRGLNIKQIGFGTFLIFGAAAVGELLAGFLADRWQRPGNRNLVMKALLAISGTVTVVAVILLRLVPTAGVAITLLAVAVFFLNWGGLYWAVPAWLAPPEQVGRVGSLMNIASSAGGVLAPIIIGYLVQATGGYSAALAFLAGCAVLYIAGSMVINFRRQLTGTAPTPDPVPVATGRLT
ncbi:MAG TPA: MFS transporter [Pseudonocardiaceae bacterium]|nr:MFS transporter [Pseudonocardiaceae bacterium]